MTDWKAIKIEYDADKISVRAIGRKFSVSDTAIRKKAKENGWKRGSQQKKVRTTKKKVRTKKKKMRSANSAPAKKRKPGRPKRVHPGGRPTDYKEEYNNIAFLACKNTGATDKQLCEMFSVSESTLNLWKIDYPEFSESLNKGKKEYDNDVVVVSLHERAIGYSHPEDKIFNNNGVPLVVPTIKHYPPETNAIKTWLYNRDPENWQDRRVHELGGKDGAPIPIAAFPSEPMSLAEWEKQMAEVEEARKLEEPKQVEAA